MKQILGSFSALVAFEAENSDCVFSGAILVEQRRDEDDPPTSAEADVTFDRTVFDAVTGRVRWTGSRLNFDGNEINLGRSPGVTFEESMTPGEQATMRFIPVGDVWAIPSTDYEPPEPSTCPVVTPVTVRRSPRTFGNKPTELYLRLGASPAGMVERKLFQGMSLQKNTRIGTGVMGEITSVDDSINYANVPLCYQIPPFAGLRRDEIVRQVAEAVGLDPVEDVICPIGKIVTKPILLTNASLLPFLNEFGAPENWLASFNEDGKLYVRVIERKDAPELPDWTLDAAEGDYDFETLEETPPAAPATRIIVSVVQPVSGTGPGGSTLVVTTRTIEEIVELYAPECVKVRPSGLPSYLYGDGTYRTLDEEELMLVFRRITDITTTNGAETRRTVTEYEFYNPRAHDPNFDTWPTGTSYNGAYGHKSFHRDEAESLMEVYFSSLETTRDINGTILGTLDVRKAWHAPRRALTFVGGSRTTLQSAPLLDPPSYIYAGGTSRVLPTEVYGVTDKIEKAYEYAADGTLASVTETQNSWHSPDSRCDITVNEEDPVDQQPDDPPYDNPPPEPPPDSNPSFYPQISGPVSQEGGTFTFKVSIVGAPQVNGYLLSTSVGIIAKATTGSIPQHGFGAGPTLADSSLNQKVLLKPYPGSPDIIEEGFAKITFHGTRPEGTVYVAFSMNGDSAAHRHSNTLIFDPWENVPPGGSL